uniref:Secreted protein n=1 Tax=Lactuca sativa TaxID=4236 RepID=A0A9R1WY77_LACSA|nr:hypothetical protein LSAT_V11C800415400 [Lactuca sativa]
MGFVIRALLLIGMVACITSVAHAIAGQATYYTVYTRKFLRLISFKTECYPSIFHNMTSFRSCFKSKLLMLLIFRKHVRYVLFTELSLYYYVWHSFCVFWSRRPRYHDCSGKLNRATFGCPANGFDLSLEAFSIGYC